MADSSRTQLFYLKESTWGVTPAAAMTELRFTAEGLGYTISNTPSGEVRSDRQVTDLIQTGADASGDITIEYSYGAYDDLMESALFSAWSTAVAVSATDLSAANSDNSFNASSTDFTAQNMSVGQWIKVGGFSNSANNGICQVASVAANKLVVTGLTLTDEAAGNTVTMGGSMLRNGTTETSFSLEKKFSDITQFLSFTGMVAGGMSLRMSTGAILTGTFGFTGKSATMAQATIGTGAPNAAAANPVLNAVNNVGNILEGGASLAGTFVQSLDIQLANSLRGIGAVGTLGNADLGSGRCAVTGNVSVYFADASLYDKYLAGTATSLSFRVTDAGGNAYVFTLPNVKFTSGAVVAGGADQDVMASFGYQALRDAGTNATIQIDRIAA